MVAYPAMAASIGRKSRVAVLQPFLKQAVVARGRHRRRQGPEQDQPRATASYADACSKLDEAVALVDTLGCDVVFKEVVPLRSVHPKFLFGSGKAIEMAGAVSASDADAVFVNSPLSGAQQKGLAEKWGGATVLDRFRVILDIFADRARTTEAKLQVELAGLKYEAAHLVQAGGANKGRDSGYDRQRGGLGAVGGSGEKALETRRRLLRDRTAEVNRKLKDVERRRGFQRGARNRRLEPTVALVGYTNVGKSSLLNQLALSRHRVGGSGDGGGSGGDGGGEKGGGGGKGGGFKAGGGSWSGGGKGMVQARNRVFDTLDPTVRSVTLPSRARCVLVDTVGFIQDLPTDLVHSFRATLEEVRRADLLLHVRDASVEPRVYEAQRAAVEETLGELGAGSVLSLEVWNKVDKEVVVERSGCRGGGDDGGGGGSGSDSGSDSGSGNGSDSYSDSDSGSCSNSGSSSSADDYHPQSPGRRVVERKGDRADRCGEDWAGEEPGAGCGKSSNTPHDMSFPGDEEEEEEVEEECTQRGFAAARVRGVDVGGREGGEGRGVDKVQGLVLDEGSSQGSGRSLANVSNPAVNCVIVGQESQTGGEREAGRGKGVNHVPVPSGSTPYEDGAIRVSAATGEGLGLLLERIDAALHLGGDGRRFSPKPVDRYQYVRVLPGQSQQ